MLPRALRCDTRTVQSVQWWAHLTSFRAFVSLVRSDVYPRSLLLPLRHGDAKGVSSALGGTFVSLDALVVLVDDAFEGGISRKRYMDRATEYRTIALPQNRHSTVLAYFKSGIEEKNLLIDREAFDRYQTQREDEQHALEDIRASRVAVDLQATEEWFTFAKLLGSARGVKLQELPSAEMQQFLIGCFGVEMARKLEGLGGSTVLVQEEHILECFLNEADHHRELSADEWSVRPDQRTLRTMQCVLLELNSFCCVPPVRRAVIVCAHVVTGSSCSVSPPTTMRHRKSIIHSRDIGCKMDSCASCNSDTNRIDS
jgi:hypothetical protein